MKRSRSVVLALSALVAGCVGSVVGDVDAPAGAPGGAAVAPGTGTAPANGTKAPGAAGQTAPDATGWALPAPCAPAIARRVVRLSDRHVANAARDLLGLAQAPALQTVSGNADAFIPNAAPGISGAVSLALRTMAESASLEATKPGRAAVQCAGAERDCAAAFIDRFATRAFRRPLVAAERTLLLQAYDGGRTAGGSHADGVRTVIEAVLQSPSFLYHTELGTPAGGGFTLTPYELATTLSLFLRDGLPDDALWAAATDGRLATAKGVEAEVDRLLAQPDVQANLSRVVGRLFQLERMQNVMKDPALGAFTPAVATSMLEETNRFIADVLWKRGGSLSELLTSRTTTIDAALASIYGVPRPASGFAPVTLPAGQRAGILTQASLLTMEASADESSVVQRGVFITRELLCFQVPSPMPDDLQAGAALKMTNPTERTRAQARAATARCAGCHGFFDPLGLPFESYDAIGRWRTTIKTPSGTFPADTTSEANSFDVRGPIRDATELAQKLAASGAVGACWAQQIASYALQARVPDAACATAGLAQAFGAASGDITRLIRAVATWDGLRTRVP